VTFANPWALVGCLAALIPLLVHLFDRRRPRPHPFAAISFVLRSQKRTASRLKLKRLLLYALRTLILLAIPLALAKPQLAQDAAAAASARGPAATAIVLDTSLSMRWQDGRSLYARARDEARDALKELTPEEPATVLLCGPDAKPPPSPSFDRARLRVLIDDAEEPSWGPADLHRCLGLAAKALEDSPVAAKRIVLVSDLAAHGFHLEMPPPTVADGKGGQVKPEVVLREVARGQALPNAALVDLKVEPATQLGPRAFQFTFTLRNFSDAPLSDVEAALVVGGRTVAKGFLEVAANGTAQKVLTHRFEAGGTVQGEVVLAPDALAEDNRRPFVLHVPEELKVLVVNGAPAAQRIRDETFFLEPALASPGSPVHATVRDAEAGLREELGQYDVLYLVNVPAPTQEEAARLTRFVEAGGGLFLSMGDRVQVGAYNDALGALLPRPLRDVRTATERDAPDADAKAGRLTQVEVAHPLFSPFTGQAGEGLQSARFFRYVLTEAQGQGSQVLAAFQDGAPALTVAQRGRGRVALFTSTVDRDWGDLAIRTSFLPLMQRMAAFLAGALEEREELRVRVGDTLVLSPPPGQSVTEVVGPGAGVPFHAQEDGSVRVGPVSVPGTYQVKNGKGEGVPALAFAAVLDATESDLTRVSPEALEAYFGEETVTQATTGSERPQVPLWTWLIAAAALAFFCEGLLLRK
jgi:Aerotolerance regulator N-terminal